MMMPRRPAFVIGPHVNVYSRAALAECAPLGAGTWVPPLELSLDAVAHINPPGDPVPGAAGPVVTEVFAFGRMPLAFSARCFTARHHRLKKDACDFRCRDDADGLLLATSEGEPFLVLADFAAYEAAQRRVDELYREPREWVRRAVANTVGMGTFSSDRSIRQYADEIWGISPVV